MDRNAIRAIEKSRYRAGLPDVKAILLIELDGDETQVLEEESRVKRAITENDGEVVIPNDDSRFWSARRGAFPAMGTIAPAYVTLDCNVLRSDLPDVLERTSEIAKKYSVYIANVFHAGDGNLHPLFLITKKILIVS